jgi:ubiquitin carboxyl-terminal hydrolase 7
MNFNELAKIVGDDIGTDAKRLRFWCMVNRQNKTVRPDTPIPDPNMSIEDAYTRLAGSKGQELKLWAEIADDVDANGDPIWPATPGQANGNVPRNTDLIVLFLKEFDVEKQSLHGIGHIYISREKKVEDLVPAILKKMSWPDRNSAGEKIQLKLFEVCLPTKLTSSTNLKVLQEIKPNMIEPMKAKQSLKAAELQDGDIVCFQLANADAKALDSDQSVLHLLGQLALTNIDTRSSMKSSRSPSILSERTLVNKTATDRVPDRIEDARLFYDFLLHKRDVWFGAHPTRTINPEQYPTFVLTLSSKNTYDQVASRVGDRLRVDPTHLRFWTVNATTGNPKASVKRGQSQNLQTILNPPYSTFSNNNQKSNAMFFEVLDISLSELDTKKALKVALLSDGISKVVCHM